MAAFYSVIQYVPDVIADERINFGVLVFDGSAAKVCFLQRWDRVFAFGGDNSNFILDFAERMEAAVQEGLLFPGDDAGNGEPLDRVIKVARGWINSIQFTEPRASLEDIDKLLESLTKTHLRQTPMTNKKIGEWLKGFKFTVEESVIGEALKPIWDEEVSSEWHAKAAVNDRLRSYMEMFSAHLFDFEGRTKLLAEVGCIRVEA